MVSEPRKQLMAWMETDYSKHTHFRLAEHLGAQGSMGGENSCGFKMFEHFVLCSASSRVIELLNTVSEPQPVKACDGLRLRVGI